MLFALLLTGGYQHGTHSTTQSLINRFIQKLIHNICCFPHKPRIFFNSKERNIKQSRWMSIIKPTKGFFAVIVFAIWYRRYKQIQQVFLSYTIWRLLNECSTFQYNTVSSREKNIRVTVFSTRICVVWDIFKRLGSEVGRGCGKTDDFRG